MSLHEVSLRRVSDGKIFTAYRRVTNNYGIDPDTNSRIVIGQQVSYGLQSGEDLNTRDGINFTSLSGMEYTLERA